MGLGGNSWVVQHKITDQWLSIEMTLLYKLGIEKNAEGSIQFHIDLETEHDWKEIIPMKRAKHF